ncbi:MAG: hypothetical protein RR946_12835, partial [Clostridia bacterium]
MAMRHDMGEEGVNANWADTIYGVPTGNAAFMGDCRIAAEHNGGTAPPSPSPQPAKKGAGLPP